jgi:hypothetical protein
MVRKSVLTSLILAIVSVILPAIVIAQAPLEPPLPAGSTYYKGRIVSQLGIGIIGCTNLQVPAADGSGCVTNGGPPYVLPIAQPTILGGVKPDNTTCAVNAVTGVLTCPGSGGGAVNHITYSCTGTASTDTSAINTALSTPGTYLYLFGNCQTNNSVILFSGDTLDWRGQTLTSTMPSSGTSFGNDIASITNEAVVNPTTTSYSCNATQNSTALTCASASFTNADINQSFACVGGLTSGVYLRTSIANITSSTAITLSDPTGAIGTGTIILSCAETIRDHDMQILAGTITMTASSNTYGRPQELAIGHANDVNINGGKWLEPDGTSDWHMVIYDVSKVTVENTFMRSYSGYGQDGVDFEGPWTNITVQNNKFDVSDDAIALKNGEYDASPQNYLLRNTNGAGHGAYILNNKGSGDSSGVTVHSSCVNASGSCIASNLDNIVIDGVVGEPENTENSGTAGFATPVTVNVAMGAASDFGTTATINQVYISHVYNVLNNVNANYTVAIGTPSVSANEYYGNITVTDVGPQNNSYPGDLAAIIVYVPTSSFQTYINTLGIYDTGYMASKSLFGVANSNATITNFLADNPISANYTFNNATVTNKYIAGNLYAGSTPVAGTSVPTDRTNPTDYFLYRAHASGFLQLSPLSTNNLSDWSNGDTTGTGWIPKCAATVSNACTQWTPENLDTQALADVDHSTSPTNGQYLGFSSAHGYYTPTNPGTDPGTQTNCLTTSCAGGSTYAVSTTYTNSSSAKVTEEVTYTAILGGGGTGGDSLISASVNSSIAAANGLSNECVGSRSINFDVPSGKNFIVNLTQIDGCGGATLAVTGWLEIQ